MFPQFSTPLFAWAGLIGATIPIIIHLLQRRRFRVVEWGPMSFLTAALRQSRRSLRIRDWLLLLVRSAAILFLGLALSRPYFPTPFLQTGGGGAVHAILLIDNSMSMGARVFDRTMLDLAKEKSQAYIRSLPAGSSITLMPWCGPEEEFSTLPLRSMADAIQAIERIEQVDLTTSLGEALELARTLSRGESDLPEKRVVLVSDFQKSIWTTPDEKLTQELPNLQFALVSGGNHPNYWVEELRIEDGIADPQTPATITARIRMKGIESDQPKEVPVRGNQEQVQVRLIVDEKTTATKTISFTGSGTDDVSQEVRFEHLFEALQLDEESSWVPIRVELAPESIPGDSLESDNSRTLMVPIVVSLPVLFVDQYGSEESAERNRIGETYPARRLLSPLAKTEVDDASSPQEKQPSRAHRHLRISELDRESLEDVRLLVLAGIADPEGKTELIREFIELGGNVLIAAGGEFNPDQWALAFDQGKGILPSPILGEFGELPTLAEGELNPFLIDVPSIRAEFRDPESEELFREPLFFKGIVLEEARDQILSLPKGEPLQDRWLSWEPPSNWTNHNEPGQVWVRLVPDGHPLIIRRGIGYGEVVFFASGLYSEWNDLARTNGVILLDKILRGLISETLPLRTLPATHSWTWNLNPGDQSRDYSIRFPKEKVDQELQIDALGGDRYGIYLKGLTKGGRYDLNSKDPERQESFAIVPPARESDLSGIDPTEAGELASLLIPPDQEISVEGARYLGRTIWKWCLTFVLLLLLLELAILAFFRHRAEGT